MTQELHSADLERTAASLPAAALAVMADLLATEAQPALLLDPDLQLIWGEAASLQNWQEILRETPRPTMGPIALRHPSGAAAELHALRGPLAGYLLLRPGLEEKNDPGAMAYRRLAHDLRGTLQAFVLAASRASAQDATLRPAVELAQVAYDQALALLDYGTGKPPREAADFDLIALLQSSVAALDPLVQNAGGALSAELPALPLVAHGQPAEIRAIVQNLVLNASELGAGTQIRLTLQAESHGPQHALALSIRDSGPGLPKDLAAWLMGQSPRPNAARASGAGYGLGLGIVRDAAQSLGATIEIPADHPNCITLRFALPKAQTPQAAPHLPSAAPSLAGIALMLVEDDAITRELLSGILTRAGARVTAYDSAEGVLSHFAQSRSQPDILLLDYQLHDSTAPQVVQALGRLGVAPLIVGLSGHSAEDIAQRGGALGVALQLQKPMSASALIEALSALWAREAKPPAPALEPQIRDELISELGAAAAQNFMQRALQQAREIAQAQDQLSHEALRQALHSAIGASGLTGLARITTALKSLQNDLRAGQDLAPAYGELHRALHASQEAIAALREAP